MPALGLAFFLLCIRAAAWKWFYVVRKHVSCQLFQETTMQWTTPAFTDLRFGFEITMYIANR